MSQFLSSSGLRLLCLLQGVYYALTGIWPLLHIESFMWVTGPKYDIWLVKTVGILILVIGIVFISASRHQRITIEISILAICSAIGLMAIDVYYSVIDRISDIYLLDALGELLLIMSWFILLRKRPILHPGSD